MVPCRSVSSVTLFVQNDGSTNLGLVEPSFSACDLVEPSFSASDQLCCELGILSFSQFGVLVKNDDFTNPKLVEPLFSYVLDAGNQQLRGVLVRFGPKRCWLVPCAFAMRRETHSFVESWCNRAMHGTTRVPLRMLCPSRCGNDTMRLASWIRERVNTA